MRKIVLLFLCGSLLACSGSVQPKIKGTGSHKKESTVQYPKQGDNDYGFANDGQDFSALYLNQTYTLDALPKFSLLEQCDLQTALQYQRNYLLKKSLSDAQYVDGLRISRADQLTVLDEIERWLQNPARNNLNVNAYKIAGKDSRGNVQFTGYFSPKIYVKRYPDARYRYAIYAKPAQTSHLPSRDEIDFQGALANQQLELAYADNLLDPFFMQIQGSGIVEFVDTGETATFAYAGKNGHAYYSIGRYLVEQGYLLPQDVSLDSIKHWLQNNPQYIRQVLSLNPSYVFFRESKQLPTGASGQPVTAYCSVAIDPKYVPYGSTLVIKRPVLDNLGRLLYHQNSIFFAQDRGGAIKGTGRVDIYTGVGEQAKQTASALKHYGAMWLLLPKQY